MASGGQTTTISAPPVDVPSPLAGVTAAINGVAMDTRNGSNAVAASFTISDSIAFDEDSSDKKQSESAALEMWVESNQEKLAKRLPQRSDKSFGFLMRDWEGQKIITSPRDYQIELFERAKRQNTIAVLDTGSGKTLIAALLLRHIIEKELEDRAGGEAPRVAFFLVDKVALVFQQHAVLNCNLDYPIEKFCGDMVKSVWSRDFWTQQFSENMVIVCTAEILYKCLHHSYIGMSEINLLIFDEAHHAKKGHPYARIIKDFYGPEPKESRPRVFGMTASPVDAQTDVKIAAAELEGLLHSEIATISDPTLLKKAVATPEDNICTYSPLRGAYDTQLTTHLKEMLFREEELIKLEAKTERNSSKLLASSSDYDKYISALPSALKVIQEHTFSPARSTLEFLSSKVRGLLGILKGRFSDPDSDTRCIVFVERRWTAVMLADLLEQPHVRIANLRVESLIGTNRGDDGGYSNTSFKEQLRTIIKFKRGEVNCIFATSVAEEGLDIPDCNVVIRFDLYKTMIQYIQSRGRARHQNSRYFHMIESGNADHRDKVSEIDECEKVLREFCSALPEDRRLAGNDFDMDYFLRKERYQRQYTVPSTGAKLTYKQSLVTLANFVSSLPHSDEVTLVPNYVVQTTEGGYIGEVLLPSVSPVSSSIGRLQSSKQAAKCSAAFEMCLELRKRKYLDDDLRPIFVKQLPVMANARLAVSSKKKDEYNMRIKPDIWVQLGTPETLFATVLTLSNAAAVGRDSRPLVMLTRTPIPEVVPFQLFFGDGRSSHVQCTNIPLSLETRKGDVQAFTTFTLKVFADVFSKEYEASPQNLPYFVVPTTCNHEHPFSKVEDTRSIIDWELLSYVENTEKVPYTGNEPEDFFSNRTDLSPRDAVLEGVVKPSHRSWKDVPHDILNYSIKAELVSLRRNLLDENSSLEETEPKICFLVLEYLRISPLPMEVVSMAYNFPAIIYRMESNIIALDACHLLKLNISSGLAIEALTKDSNSTEDDEPSEEPVDFQPGMGSNYERLEFLGDSFLKMATTISLFTLIPDKSEFDYHVERMCLVCNRNLFNNALDVKLQEYIRSKPFNRRTWYPEGLTLKKGKKTTEKNTHTLGDKTIADVCESIIGAAYMTTRDGNNFDMAIQAVTRVTKHKNHPMESWDEYYASYKMPPWQTTEPTAAQLDLAQLIKETMGYEFKHPRLLRSAFRHPSYPRSYENLPSYQRLEFLGDALLDMVVVDWLFVNNPTQGPQWLTEHKTAIVSNRFLGCLAATLGFHRHMLSLHAALQKQIHEYVAELGQARAEAEDDAARRGLPRSAAARDYWVGVSQPPKCLADMAEAYVGAVFVDSGYDYATVRAFFDAHVRPWFADLRLYDAFARRHPVTGCADLLAQRFRCRYWGMPSHEVPVVDPEGMLTGAPPRWAVAFMVHRQVVGHGVSDSTRYAKVYAAKEALKALHRMDLAEFRDKFGCDCVPEEAADAMEMATAV
ncbi:Dicer-like protein 1 [Pleurostoma richardsiae]|uniref:Dicer-like protein 1 n=1 Tax=Pleurostoma richardsiae TaxID=41990 RepID=A0AA38VPT0_9PEZI|nr:Dicer-like protein 1 [Pleurostoma richardsiae]